MVFLSKKIRRGQFRELGRISEYALYNNAIRKYENLMLKTLYIPDDADMVASIGSELHNLLSGIKGMIGYLRAE